MVVRSAKDAGFRWPRSNSSLSRPTCGLVSQVLAIRQISRTTGVLQHDLGIDDVQPSTEFETDFFEITHLLKAEAFL